MAWAFVTGQATSTSALVGAQTVAATLTNTVGSGNCVIGHVTWDLSLGSAISTIKDDLNNSYTLGLAVPDNTNTQAHTVFYLWNITNSPKTVTVTFTNAATSARGVGIAEYSGIATAADPKDIQEGRIQSSPGTGTDAISSSASGTATNAANELLGGFWLNTTGAAAGAAGTGFTSRTNSSTIPIRVEDKDSGSSGTAARSTFTDVAGGGSQTYSTIATTFKIPGGAAGSPAIINPHDLPPRGSLNRPELQGYLEGTKLNLLGLDQFFGAPGQAHQNPDQPNPRGYAFPIDSRTWLDPLKINLLRPQIAQFDWPNPRGYLNRPDLSFFDALKLNLLHQDQFFGAAGQGPANLDQPNPRGYPFPMDGRTLIEAFNPNLVTLPPPTQPQPVPDQPNAKGYLFSTTAINYVQQPNPNLFPPPPSPPPPPPPPPPDNSTGGGQPVGGGRRRQILARTKPEAEARWTRETPPQVIKPPAPPKAPEEARKADLKVIDAVPKTKASDTRKVRTMPTGPTWADMERAKLELTRLRQELADQQDEDDVEILLMTIH
jgi:hypothetical protein